MFEQRDGERCVWLDSCGRVEVVTEELLNKVPRFGGTIASAEVEQDGVTAVDVDDTEIALGWDRICADRAVMMTQLNS